MVTRTGVLAVMCCAAGSAFGQASFPAVFVTNNGNLRGSATSYRVHPDGTVTMVEEFVIGERVSGSPSIPTTNAYSGALTPNGKYLAVSHATAASTEQISILRVNVDGTMSIYTSFLVPDSPLDLKWLNDTKLAVTETRTSGINRIHVYDFNEAAGTFARVDTESVNGFCSWLALSPDGRWLIANESPLSGGGGVASFAVSPEGLLSPGNTIVFGGYSLGMCFDISGSYVYAFSGSSGPARTHGFAFDGLTGWMDYLPGSPYYLPGTSPKQGVVSPDGTKLLVCYGSDGTLRVNDLNPGTGDVTPTEHMFDVGSQGSIGNLDVMRIHGMDLVFFTDKETFDGTPRGLCSFAIGPDGALTQKSLRVDSGGIAPTDVIAWRGAPGQPGGCGSGDFDGDGDTATDADIEAFFACIAGSCCPQCGSGDFDGDGDTATDADIEAFFRVIAGGTC